MGIFNDVVALAKAGWTPSDIKEILEKDKEDKKEPEDKKKEPEDKKKEPEDKKKEPEDKKKKPADDEDYKALYEATKKDLEELQQKNTKENIKPDDVDRDALFKNIKSSIC